MTILAFASSKGGVGKSTFTPGTWQRRPTSMAPALKAIIHQWQLFASSMIDGRTASELAPHGGNHRPRQELSTHLRIDGKE